MSKAPKPGHYWVRYKIEPEVTIGEFVLFTDYGKPGWRLVGSEVPYSIADIHILSKRIKPPKDKA